MNSTSNTIAYDVNSEPIFDSNQISAMLPHRYPFLLVDKIIQIDKESITGLKNVTINEPFFQGHFPGNPVMPGVLQVEALAQTAGVLALNNLEEPSNYWLYFLGIDNCRFKKMVVPGDTLFLRCSLLSEIRRKKKKIQGDAFVGEKLACTAKMTAMMVKRKLENWLRLKVFIHPLNKSLRI